MGLERKRLELRGDRGEIARDEERDNQRVREGKKEVH